MSSSVSFEAMRKPRNERRRSSSCSPPSSRSDASFVAASFSVARLLSLIYVASAIGVTAAFQCPPDHYPYPSDACSSCFTIVNDRRNFDSAHGYCSVLGGELTTTENETNFELLSRYLGGLNESRRLWIGYRYSSSGSRIGLEGNEAPGVVLDDGNFNGSTSGNDRSCVGMENGKFIVASCTSELPFICTIVYNAPSAVKQPNANIVYAAQSQANIQLQADISGNGIKFPVWKFNGMGIRQGENGITVSTSNQVSTGLIATLTISSYDPAAHLGTYEVQANNQAGTAVVASWLLRDAVINLTEMPRNLSIPKGQMAAFECHGNESKPRPTVTWYKDSTQIINGTEPRLFVSELSGTLFIRNVQNSDAGLYHCVLSNVAGTLTSQSASLTMLPLGTEFALDFILNPHNLTVLRGESYSVECSAAQSRQPTLITTVFDIRGPNSENVLSYTYPENEGFPVYRVESATLSEPDCYYCGTRSDPFDVSLLSGSYKSMITVHAAAQIERFSTIRNGLRTEDNFQSIPSGGSASLECEFSGIPIPSTVDWTRNGVSITNGIVPGSNTSRLSIPSLNESAIYQCHVENKYGRDSQTVFLCTVEQEDGVPGPVSFAAMPDTNTSIYVSWNEATPPRIHPLLLRYEILFHDATNNVSSTFGPFLSTQTSYTITSLEPNTEYKVSMVATSLQGRSDVTSQSVVTFPNPPTERVNNITVQRTDDNMNLIIQWEPYMTPEGRLVTTATYNIEYRVFRSGSSVSRDTTGTLEVISDLSNAEDYEVRVRVTVQIVRDPPQFASSEWSEYIRVHGITTLPPAPTSLPPQTGGVSPEGRGGLTTMGLLLLIIFVVLGVIVAVVVVIVIIAVICWFKKPGGKYSIQDRKRRKRSKGPQTPMRDEIFNISTSLPTSPSTSPPPLSISNRLGGGSRHSSSVLGSRNSERGSGTMNNGAAGLGGALIRNQENGGVRSNGGGGGGGSDANCSLPMNVSNQSLRRSGSVSPQPLPPPPPITDVDSPYTTTSMHTNLYTMEPFTNHHDPHIVISPPPLASSVNVGFTDQVHDIPTHHFHKLDISDEMSFEACGSPEVFDRLEGFPEEEPAPVRTMATFDIITTGGTDAGSCDTLTRDGVDSRNYDIDSPATMSSLVNQTPEPQADHRVTFAPAIITISPVPHVNQELSNAILELNSSSCNNNDGQRFFASGGASDIFNDYEQLPPVAEIVEGNELLMSDDLQLEPPSAIVV